MDKLNKTLVEKIKKLQKKFSHGDKANQKEINESCKELEKYREILLPNEKEELFTLVDAQGNFTNLTAPRWFCHLLGLRHMSVHVLLQWQSPILGNVFVLQIRSWAKSDSPGHVDISVGGHVIGDGPLISKESAYREMEEELGISTNELVSEELTYKTGYESTDINEQANFFNTEWRNVYLAEITLKGFEKIRFSDKEVVGLYLCPSSEAKHLLNQGIIPIASGLRLSLPYCL